MMNRRTYEILSGSLRRHVTISRGSIVVRLGHNQKIGCQTLNLPPWQTCLGRPCYRYCYAMGTSGDPVRPGPHWRACRRAWEDNAAHIRNDSAAVGELVGDHLRYSRARFFRWHSAGDCLPESPRAIMRACRASPQCRHLIYTRDRDAFEALMTADLPNLAVIWSEEPGGYPDLGPYAANRATVYPKHGEAPVDHYDCPGDCTRCRICWTATGHADRICVAFRAHGRFAGRVTS